MQKSAISFSLFLLIGSLIMLVPFTSINFPNVKAQEYGVYDDSYSKYPTDDKKYECQTGPFEGFFVGSVEFCKFNKFNKDDRKDVRDNRTGTQGPPGPPGPTGPQGIQGAPGERGLQGLTGQQGLTGERGLKGLTGQQGLTGERGQPGITQLNGTNTYQNTTGVFNTVDSSTTGQATCDIGDFVVTGGFIITGFSGSAERIFELTNRPILIPYASGWEVLLETNELGGDVNYNVHAICFDNPPLR